MSTSVVPFQAGEEASASKLNQDLEAVRALGQAVMDEQTTKLLDLERALNSLNGRRQRAGNSVEPTALAVFAVTDLLSTDQNQTTATVRIDTGAVTLRERPQIVTAQIKSTQFSSSTGTVTPLDNDQQMYQVYCPDGSIPAGVFLLELMSPLDLTLLVIDISAMMSQPTITLEVSADGLVWVPAQVEQNGYSLTGVIPPTVVRYVRLSMTPAQSDNIGSQTFTFGLTDFSASAVEFQLASEWVSLPVTFSPLGQNVQLVTDNDSRLSFYLALAADNSQPFAAVTPGVPLAIPGIASQTFRQAGRTRTGQRDREQRSGDGLDRPERSRHYRSATGRSEPEQVELAGDLDRRQRFLLSSLLLGGRQHDVHRFSAYRSGNHECLPEGRLLDDRPDHNPEFPRGHSRRGLTCPISTLTTWS